MRIIKINNYLKSIYTPHIFLQNPNHQCKSAYLDVEDGVIKTDNNYPGLGWFMPWADKVYGKTPGGRLIATMGFAVKTKEVFLSKSDFKYIGLYSEFHTSNLFSYNIENNNFELRQLYWRDNKADGIISELDFTGKADEKIYAILYIDSTDSEFTISSKKSGFEIETSVGKKFVFPKFYFSTGSEIKNIITSESIETLKSSIDKNVFSNFTSKKCNRLYLACEVENITQFYLGENDVKIDELYADCSLSSVLCKENDFYKDFPYLEGDWPEVWKHGWLYDFETTRLCTLPTKGIFKDWWPTWMTQWPRVVLAEGTMDMNRLGYVNIDIAKSAVLSIFKAAKEFKNYDQAPCLFASGVPNMVAKDGEVCGTSIAWCMPFYQIYDLYLRCLDKDWIGELYPYMKKLLEWWLNNRTDDKGWMVYKCTWEAGEDNNPRIDPEETGSSVISDTIRPVELQACMAHSAEIMTRFCNELDIVEDLTFWKEIKEKYKNKLQGLWDFDSKRFRDWNKVTNSFIKETGVNNYWEQDFTRFSPLSLTAVQFDLITEEQFSLMKEEVALFNQVPFNIWPSWNFVVMEAATKLGLNKFASEFACGILDRVYTENDRYDTDIECPLPGNAREYWPMDLKEYGGNHAYAWGAQTASMLIRQIMGIKASENTTEDEMLLTPAIPEKMMIPGKVYLMKNFRYRSIKFDLAYRIIDEENISINLSFIGGESKDILIAGKPLKEKTRIKNYQSYIVKY